MPSVGELGDPLLEPVEVRDVEALEVEPVFERPGEDEVVRLVGVVEVRLREDAHPQLGERRVGERPQRLLLQRVGLVGPGVRRGAERAVPGAVGVPEVEAVDAHRAVAALARAATTVTVPSMPSSDRAVDRVTKVHSPSTSASARMT